MIWAVVRLRGFEAIQTVLLQLAPYHTAQDIIFFKIMVPQCTDDVDKHNQCQHVRENHV